MAFRIWQSIKNCSDSSFFGENRICDAQADRAGLITFLQSILPATIFSDYPDFNQGRQGAELTYPRCCQVSLVHCLAGSIRLNVHLTFLENGPACQELLGSDQCSGHQW